MAKFFNTAGPIREDKHYFIPLSQRIDVAEILMLIDQEKYFVIHAPRQSGKTTTLLELCKILNQSGKYKGLYINVEGAQTAKGDVEQATRMIANVLVKMEQETLGETFFKEHIHDTLAVAPANGFEMLMAKWARQSPLPTVLFIDEVDALVGDSLVILLRQIRGGYTSRPKNFPQSIVLCGVRDMRDYRLDDGLGKAPVTGGSVYQKFPQK